MVFSSSNPLLMLIDLQYAIDDPRWGVRNNPQAEEQISKLLNIWREQRLPVLHVKHMSTDPGSPYLPGTDGNDFKAFAAPLAAEWILEKDTNSAFIRTDLDTQLRKQGITEVVIVGVITNNSVEATARMAGNLGYRTVVVSDATYTFNKVDYAGNEHAAEVVHNMALANLNQEYASILTADDIISLL
ncbi:cysteine hydrolase family protein [Saccharospirillum sp. MSK14-1]|uniref:cysteine hydrolase family protein n=1 Tax=Saccharospirillum sp. MSK14-1 TaxID=1897632 RepID=UPI0018EE4F3B|nr:cysteine hydrolase family protein [Saccharospirillum sp. MSK14-1]